MEIAPYTRDFMSETRDISTQSLLYVPPSLFSEAESSEDCLISTTGSGTASTTTDAFVSSSESPYREFLRFDWWNEATLGQKFLGGGIAVVAGAFVAGTFVLGGEIILGGGLAAGSISSIGWASGVAAIVDGATLAIVAPLADYGQVDSYADLIRQARKGLEDWKENPSASFDYGHFILDLERIGRQGVEPLATDEQWTNLTDRCRDGVSSKAPPENQAERVIQRLYLFSGIRHYARDQPGISPVVMGEGGNCEAESGLIVSALNESSVSFESPEILGVQNFQDHLQAVVYNYEDGTVWNLLTGETSPIVLGPIYQPPILLQAFLTKRGETSPVSAQELLIVAADENAPRLTPNPESFSRGESPFQFPDTDYVFTSGPIPERAELSMPQPRNGSSGASGAGHMGGAVPSAGPLAISLDELPVIHYYDDIRTRLENSPFGFVRYYRPDGPMVALFRTNADKDFYLSLSVQDRREFLLLRMNEGLKRFFETPDTIHTLDLLSSPSTLAEGDL